MSLYTVRKDNWLKNNIINQMSYCFNNYHISYQGNYNCVKIHVYMRSYPHYYGNKQTYPWTDIRDNIQYSKNQTHNQGLLEINPCDRHPYCDQYHNTSALYDNANKIPRKQAFNRKK